MSGPRKFTAKALSQLIRDRTNEGQELVDFVYSIAIGKKMGAGAKAINADLSLRMTAVAWLADRGWGKAAQVVEFEDVTSHEQLEAYTTEQLEKIASAITTEDKA